MVSHLAVPAVAGSVVFHPTVLVKAVMEKANVDFPLIAPVVVGCVVFPLIVPVVVGCAGFPLIVPVGAVHVASHLTVLEVKVAI